ncbi:xanthine dehydrogenase family protein subunit M [Actinomycetospora sp. OC33-EN08]|uniref:Xanthine dehydrogenase family protein subunit M n=1 Tax=Actinomycetospora aurantiaca TaxID=3129233 RepID=A0ABU8MT85_9PSEU
MPEVRPFVYHRATSVDDAIAAVGGDARAAYLAGGTTQLDLMKDGVLAPELLVDITRLPLRGIDVLDDVDDGDEVLHVGALTTMEQLARHPVVSDRLPLLAQSLLSGASTQLRNMATIGGNLLQRTRCRYYRDPTIGACNRRLPGTGCAAVQQTARMHAVLGAGPRCIAVHASDLAVALVALDAVVEITGPDGARRVPLRDFYVPADVDPAREHAIGHGDLVTAIRIPIPAFARNSGYLKVRDRASYEFAAVSVAAAFDVEHGRVGEARIAFGGIGSVPWRAVEAEELLRGASVSDTDVGAAGRAALAGAFTVPGTAFKPELAIGALVRLAGVLTGTRGAVLV